MRRFALNAMFLALVYVLGIVLPRSAFAEEQGNAKSLRVAIAQIPVSADIATNAATIHRALDKAIEANAEILLTPEGSLSGYTHLFDQKQVDKHLPAILKKASAAHLALALGTCFVEPHDSKCYNQIRFYDTDGTYRGFHSKTLLRGTLTEPPVGGTLTDLWAKALVLQDGNGARAVLITVDVNNISRDLSAPVCEELQKQFGLERQSIALNASHTHSGPAMGARAYYTSTDQQHQDLKDYTADLKRKLIAVVGEALKNLAPAKLKWGNGKATFAVNRRNNREADVPKLRTEGKLRGPVDHDVPVLFVQDAAGRMRAVVCGYACPATTLSGYQISADWPGYAQIDLEKMNPGAIALTWIGCGGDQNPVPRRKVEYAQDYGRQLADAVEKVQPDKAKPIVGKLVCSYAEIDMPFARLPTRDELRKTLAGWKANERPDNWKVVDGAIVGNGERSHLYYMKEQVKDFELKADVMINKGGNSGIYFHIKHHEDGWFYDGHEAQINNTHGDPVKTGSLWAVVKLYESNAKDDTWFSMHITVKGQNIVVRVGRKVVVDYTEPEGAKRPRRLSQGYLARQAHDPGSTVKFRNIKLKKLPPAR